MSPQLAIDGQAIAGFCRRHHVRRLALFGSVPRDDFGPQSDVDVLVEFEAGHVPGFVFFDMQEELAGILGRPVDLHTPGPSAGTSSTASCARRWTSMSRHDDGVRLRHMLDAARQAVEFTRGRSSADLRRDAQLALTRLVEIIGEAAKNVSPETRAGPRRFRGAPSPERETGSSTPTSPAPRRGRLLRRAN